MRKILKITSIMLLLLLIFIVGCNSTQNAENNLTPASTNTATPTPKKPYTLKDQSNEVSQFFSGIGMAETKSDLHNWEQQYLCFVKEGAILYKDRQLTKQYSVADNKSEQIYVMRKLDNDVYEHTSSNFVIYIRSTDITIINAEAFMDSHSKKLSDATNLSFIKTVFRNGSFLIECLEDCKNQQSLSLFYFDENGNFIRKFWCEKLNAAYMGERYWAQLDLNKDGMLDFIMVASSKHKANPEFYTTRNMSEVRNNTFYGSDKYIDMLNKEHKSSCIWLSDIETGGYKEIICYKNDELPFKMDDYVFFVTEARFIIEYYLYDYVY